MTQVVMITAGLQWVAKSPMTYGGIMLGTMSSPCSQIDDTSGNDNNWTPVGGQIAND
jgi:hypothetical protein